MWAVWGLMCAVLCCFVRDTAAAIGKFILLITLPVPNQGLI